MRISSCTVLAAAVVAAPALAKPITPLERETRVWELVRDKRWTEFEAEIAPNYVGLGTDGIRSRTRDLAGVRTYDLKSFAISNFHNQMIDSDDMLMTYSADVRASRGDVDLSGRYWVATVWHRRRGKWLTVYHTELKAK